MNRLEFIKNLFTASSLAILPNIDLKQYQKIYLHQSFVRGFQYYMGKELIEKMKTGDMLELVREPDNQYDEDAIALYYQGKKIGFIPAESNETLAKLLDANLLELHCEITAINMKAKSWENIFIALYALKPMESSKVESNWEHLTLQESPHYHTVYDTEKVYRFTRTDLDKEIEEELEEEENWKWSGMERDIANSESKPIIEFKIEEMVKSLNSNQSIKDIMENIDTILDENGKIVKSVRKVNTQITISNNLLSKMIEADKL